LRTGIADLQVPPHPLPRSPMGSGGTNGLRPAVFFPGHRCALPRADLWCPFGAVRFAFEPAGRPVAERPAAPLGERELLPPLRELARSPVAPVTPWHPWQPRAGVYDRKVRGDKPRGSLREFVWSGRPLTQRGEVGCRRRRTYRRRRPVAARPAVPLGKRDLLGGPEGRRYIGGERGSRRRRTCAEGVRKPLPDGRGSD
jgi:hypothetical protein